MLLATQKFCDRYGITPQVPDYPQLCRIAGAFANLPYENVTKILKDSQSITSAAKLRHAEEVLLDHIRWNTGGTCFSLCDALLSILRDTGFEAFVAMADMRYGPNIHCAVVVKIQKNRFLLDPGYLLHEPLPLPVANLEVQRKSPMNTVVVVNEEPGIYSLFTIEGVQKKWRYRLRAVPIPEAEFQRHWLHSFSLNTMEQLMLSRLNENGRLYFRKDRLEQVSGAERVKTIVHPGDIHELSRIFGVPSDMIRMACTALSGQSKRSAN